MGRAPHNFKDEDSEPQRSGDLVKTHTSLEESLGLKTSDSPGQRSQGCGQSVLCSAEEVLVFS